MSSSTAQAIKPMNQTIQHTISSPTLKLYIVLNGPNYKLREGGWVKSSPYLLSLVKIQKKSSSWSPILYTHNLGSNERICGYLHTKTNKDNLHKKQTLRTKIAWGASQEARHKSRRTRASQALKVPVKARINLSKEEHQSSQAWS